MGGLTYIKHNGRELQSYLDRLGDTYEIGSKIPWKALFNSPGAWQNGFDEAWDYEHDKLVRQCVLVIKDLTLVEIVELPIVDGVVQREETYAALRAKYGTEFETPPRDLWPEIAWEAFEWRNQCYKSQQAKELAEYLERVRATWKPPVGAEPSRDETGCPFNLLGEPPKTLEEALTMAEAAWYAGSFTRAFLRQPGFMRQIMNVWKELPELTANVRDEVLNEFVPQIGWRYGDEMLERAAAYRAERLLKERNLWPTNEVEYPVGVLVKVDHGLTDDDRTNPGTLQIAVKQLTDECAVPPQLGEKALNITTKPIKILDS